MLIGFKSVIYHKTLFKNKFIGEYEYLLDQIMRVEKYAHMTDDTETKLLEEAVQTGYRREGENVAITDDMVSKEA